MRARVAAVLAGDRERGGGQAGDSLLAGALIKALTYINREQAERGEGGKLRPRLLVLSATGDTAAQYMNYMNVFFTAQKLGIPVDTCMVHRDSGLLQQGSDITGGTYCKVEELKGLLQVLTWLFLPGPGTRAMLGTPPPVKASSYINIDSRMEIS